MVESAAPGAFHVETKRKVDKTEFFFHFKLNQELFNIHKLMLKLQLYLLIYYLRLIPNVYVSGEL